MAEDREEACGRIFTTRSASGLRRNDRMQMAARAGMETAALICKRRLMGPLIPLGLSVYKTSPSAGLTRTVTSRSRGRDGPR